MGAEQEGLFKYGLDLDSDLRDIQPGFYSYLRNGTANSTDSRTKGAAVSVKSWAKQERFWNAQSRSFQTFVLPSGTNKCVAATKDVKNNAIIFFNMNSNGYHVVFRYWIAPTGIDPFIEALSLYIPGAPPITWGNALAFTKRFQNPGVIETGRSLSGLTRQPQHPVFGNTIPVQLVFWTDGVQDPFRLNTTDLYVKLDSGVLGIDKYWLTVGKIQPQIGPRILFQQDPTRKSNFIPYRHLQFAYRYKYKDGEYTPLSPYSCISELWKTQYFYLNFDKPIFPGDNNSILVNASLTAPDTADEIEWFVREGNGAGNGNTNPEWYRFSVTEASNTQTIYYGDEETIALSQIDGRTLFYNIPQKADQQEITDGNQVVYGGITEGRDFIEVQGSVSEIEEEVPFVAYPTTKKVFGGASFFPFGADIVSVSDRQPGEIIYGKCEIGGPLGPAIIDNLTYSYVLTAADIADIDVFGQNLADAISAQLNKSVLYNATLNAILGNLGASAEIVRFPTNYDGYVFEVNNPVPCFKEGANHKFAIVHFDEFMRQGPVEEIGELYIPFVTERYPILGVYEYIPKKYGVEIEITSLPPIWAKYYKILHKCNIKKCAQFLAADFDYTNGALEITVKSYKIFVDGNNPTVSGFTFGSKGVADFEYTEWVGNKLRFMTQKVANADMDNNPRQVLPMYVEIDIKAVKTDNDGHPVLVVSDFGYPLSSIGENSLFEVFQQGYEPVYFELPMVEANTGLTQYGTITNPGQVSRAYDFGTTYETYMGNIYKYWRSMASDSGLPGQFHIESFSISDWWKSEFNSRGRVQGETPNMKSQYIFSMLRWTGKLFENTNINNTNVFLEGDYKILEQKYGGISGLRQIGYTLKIVQWANVASCFVGRRELQNSDGSTQLVVTGDNLIGTVNYSEDSYGSKNPESIYVRSRSLFFFDILNRCFVRNDPNGSDEISKKGAIAHWQEIADLISSGGGEVLTGWDQENKLLYALASVEGDFHSCIAWAPDKGLWDSLHDHDFELTPIDGYGDCLSGAVAFFNGQPWLLNAGPDYLSILGVDKDFSAATSANATPKKVKVFMASSIRANRPARSEQYIPASEINPNGQRSEISKTQYKYREGVYYSETNRNYLRFGQPSTEQEKRFGIINGDQLRGHACETKVIFDGNEIVLLYSITTEMVGSEQS